MEAAPERWPTHTDQPATSPRSPPGRMNRRVPTRCAGSRPRSAAATTSTDSSGTSSTRRSRCSVSTRQACGCSRMARPRSISWRSVACRRRSSTSSAPCHAVPRRRAWMRCATRESGSSAGISGRPCHGCARSTGEPGSRPSASSRSCSATTSLGLLVLYHLREYAWTPEETEVARAFADHMATAIGNARLAESTRTMADRLRAISELAGRLNRLQDVEGIAQAIVSGARALIAHDTIRVYRVDHDSGMCEPIGFQGTFMGVTDPDPALLRVAVGTGLTGLGGGPRRTCPARRRDGGSAGARRSLDRRPGVDAARPDAVRRHGPRRDRRLEATAWTASTTTTR